MATPPKRWSNSLASSAKLASVTCKESKVVCASIAGKLGAKDGFSLASRSNTSLKMTRIRSCFNAVADFLSARLKSNRICPISLLGILDLQEINWIFADMGYKKRVNYAFH